MFRSLRAILSQRWSITGRLTRHYFLSSALLLLIVAVSLYFGLWHSLLVQDRALVASKTRVLRVLVEQGDTGALRSEVEHEAGEEGGLHYYLRVVAPDGRTLLETPGMGALIPPGRFAGLGDSPEPRELAPGRHYLLAVDRTSGGQQLQAALDMDHNREMLAAYRRQLAATVLAGVLLAGLFGAVIARRALRPVALIAHAAQQVTASHLDTRISASAWPAELTALAREFDRMLDRLEDSFRRLNQCTGDLAHALRNPINNLRGEAEVVLQRARTPHEYQQAVASSLEEYDRLTRLIDGLLFIARADDARQAVERRQFAVCPEAEAVREFYDALAAEKGVRVVIEGDACLHADAMLVRRALSNLLANALKHTPSGGTVAITARPLDGGGVELEVADTGAGIPAEHVSRVFERFYQVDKTRDQPAKGAGLGLAIVQSIMRLHGGIAELTSVVGKGTRVILRFPGPAAGAG